MRNKIIRTILTIFIILLFAIPFYWMILTSIKSLGETLKVPPSFFVTDIKFENFSKAWNSGPFARYLLNSVIVTLSILLLQFLTVVPAAYAYARWNFIGKNISFGIILATMMIPTQLIFLPVFIMYSKWGMINSYPTLILPFASSAFAIFMLRQSFKQIPKQVIEAAKLDGATEAQIMRKIMIPMVKSTIITLGLITFISTWNDYFWPLVMTTKTNMRTLPVGISELMNAEMGISYNFIMAGNLILILPVLIVFFLAQKEIINAFTYMGDK